MGARRGNVLGLQTSAAAAAGVHAGREGGGAGGGRKGHGEDRGQEESGRVLQANKKSGHFRTGGLMR